MRSQHIGRKIFARAGKIVAFASGMTLTFAGLFCLILAAHFLRGGALAGAFLCLALPAVAIVTRARWALRGLQGLLLIGSATWIWTAAGIGAERRAAGEPWLRMAIILGTTAALSALAAFLLKRDLAVSLPDE